MVLQDENVLCFSDKKRAPEAMSLSPDSKILFFIERYYNDKGGKVILLDTTKTPFLPIKSVTLGLDFPLDIKYLTSGIDTILISSHMKKVIKAVGGTDGRSIWSVGPVVLGEKIHPHGICVSAEGNVNQADPSKMEYSHYLAYVFTVGVIRFVHGRGGG